MMNQARRIRTTAKIQQRARELRQEMTPAERLLWDCLRSHRLDGLKFRRQHPLGSFIVDFYCPEHCLVVEDGDVHDYQIEDDLQRTSYLESQGFQVIRFRNSEVEKDIDTVLASIRDACQPPTHEFER